MKRTLFLITSLLYFYSPFAANANWQYAISHFDRKEYRSGSYNSQILQHSNGWMYFVNSRGLLEFDGAYWQQYNPDGLIPQTIKEGPDGTLYAGTHNGFGYFLPDTQGGMKFVNISDSLKGFNGSICQIHPTTSGIYFQSEWEVYFWDFEQIKTIRSKSRIMHSDFINNQFYLATEKGLFVVSGDEPLLMANTDKLSSLDILGMYPSGENILFITREDGLFLYDGFSFASQTTVADPNIINKRLSSVTYRDGMLAMGTEADGVVLFNTRTGNIDIFNDGNGLNGNTVFSTLFDKEQNLWLALDNGIACIHLQNPVYRLWGNQGTGGSGYTACLLGETLYMGTEKGIYKTTFRSGKVTDQTVTQLPGIQGPVRRLENYSGKIVGATAKGVIVINNYTEELIPLVDVKDITPLSNNIMLAAYRSGLCKLHLLDGTSDIKHIEGFNIPCQQLIATGNKTVWAKTFRNEIYRLSLSDQLEEVTEAINYTEHLPASVIIRSLLQFNDQLVLATSNGLWHYDATADKWDTYGWLENITGKHTDYNYIYQSPDGSIWFAADKMLRTVLYDNENDTYTTPSYGNTWKNELVPTHESILTLTNKYTLMGTEDGFMILKPGDTRLESKSAQLRIRKIIGTENKEEILYSAGYLPDDSKIKFKECHTSIRIENSLSQYNKTLQTFYSYRLTGKSKTDWSDFTELSYKEFTNLKPGSYTIEVKAKNEEMKEPLYSSLAFTIPSPWYRSGIAQLIYFALIALLIYYYYQYYKEPIRKKVLSLLPAAQGTGKDRIAQQGTAQEKEMILLSELKHKSDELLRSNLLLVQKKEILEEIKKGIQQMTESFNKNNPKEAEQKAFDLLSQLESNVRSQDDLKSFKHTFESLQKEFMKAISDRFPQLNQKDKLLCTYIKMNLMSKDIAPLLNISVRGVEISRYRLRKKLNLAEKDNLAEFLQNM